MLSYAFGMLYTPHKRVNIFFCSFPSIIQYLKQLSTVNIGGTITPSSIYFMHFKTYLKHFACVGVVFLQKILFCGFEQRVKQEKKVPESACVCMCGFLLLPFRV